MQPCKPYGSLVLIKANAKFNIVQYNFIMPCCRSPVKYLITEIIQTNQLKAWDCSIQIITQQSRSPVTASSNRGLNICGGVWDQKPDLCISVTFTFVTDCFAHRALLSLLFKGSHKRDKSHPTAHIFRLVWASKGEHDKMIVAFRGHLLAQVLYEWIVWGNENMTTAASFFSDVPLRCLCWGLQAGSNISKMHIVKAVQWLTVSMVQCCINCSEYWSIPHFFKEDNNKQSMFYRRYPQFTTAIRDSKSACSRLKFCTRAPSMQKCE